MGALEKETGFNVRGLQQLVFGRPTEKVEMGWSMDLGFAVTADVRCLSSHVQCLIYHHCDIASIGQSTSRNQAAVACQNDLRVKQ
jgi:hypothetical protein